MLLSLYIENVALIQKLNIDLGGGLTVLTGETGAGKTIIVGTLSLLCGARSDREIVRTGCDYALAEGFFGNLSEKEAEGIASLGFETDEDGGIMLSRRITSDGRSVCKINGRTVSVGILKEIGKTLMSLHGQQESMELSDSMTHLPLLDSFADCDGLIEEYKTLYAERNALLSTLKELENEVDNSAQRADMLDFQIAELQTAHLKAGELAQLEAESVRLSSFEKIAEGTSDAYNALYGAPSAYELVNKAQNKLKRLVSVLPEAEELVKRLDSVSLEIKDISETLGDFASDDGENVTSRLNKVESRIAELKRLEKKYRISADELIEKLAELEKERDAIQNADELLEIQKKAVLEKECELQKCAEKLSNVRKQKAFELCQSVKKQLEELDMPSVRFEAKFEKTDFTPSGTDSFEFLIAPNEGEEPKPMSKIASGGELSRIMLSVKSALRAKLGSSCTVFDEIDTGISGKTSEKIGIKLKKLAKDNSQIICVTHSAQIASLADTHFFISKSESDGRVMTAVDVLSDEGRVEEIARILGGIEITEAQRAAAREMIEERKGI